MSELTLHYAVPSRGMSVHWLLEELGQPYTRVLLDLEKEEHKTPAFLAMNPLGKVPVLQHGDKVMTETAAICMYLTDVFPEAGLTVPQDSPHRGDYLRWMFFAPVTAEPAILWKALGALTDEIDYKPFAEVEAVASTLELLLEGREFAVDDHFTAADVMIGSTIMWGLRLMPVLPALPALVKYWEVLEQRPAYQRASAIDQKIMAEKAAI